MKNFILLFLFLCTSNYYFSQQEDKRGEPIKVSRSVSDVRASERTQFVYPGCSGRYSGMEVSSCITNFLNRDLNLIMNQMGMSLCVNLSLLPLMFP